MRTPWLVVLLLILLPVVLVSPNLSREFESIDSFSLLSAWMPLLIVLVSTVAVIFLLRLMKWHPRRRHRP
jgi:protein-S-isoprenylcysteine O-methyltransferase Ste14